MLLTRAHTQNVAEIDEIHWKIELEDIVQPASERAVYLELEHHLRAMDMTIKRSKKNESDRERRLAKSLGDSRYVTIPHPFFLLPPLTHPSFVTAAPRRKPCLSAVPISTSTRAKPTTP